MGRKQHIVKRTKETTSLALDPDAVSRGEAYSRRHGILLPRLINDFLRSLPLEMSEQKLSPAVERLRGIAVGGKADRAAHRDHLYRKHAGR